MSKETRKAELMARAKEIMEATLGGAKYKGKENPNNEKKRNPTKADQKMNRKRADNAIDRHTYGGEPHSNSAVTAAKRVRPN